MLNEESVEFFLLYYKEIKVMNVLSQNYRSKDFCVFFYILICGTACCFRDEQYHMSFSFLLLTYIFLYVNNVLAFLSDLRSLLVMEYSSRFFYQ